MIQYKKYSKHSISSVNVTTSTGSHTIESK